MTRSGVSRPRLAVLSLVLPGLIFLEAVHSQPVESQGCFCINEVGNVNCDYADLVTLSDLALLVDHLYITEVRLPNRDEANIDADPAGVIDIADVMLLIDHLFISKVTLPLCPAPPNAPPETRLATPLSAEPFIDDVAPGSPTTGVFFDWSAQDPVDHPYFPPPFEFEYRLYGPYSDSVLELILDSFVVTVFRPNDYDQLRLGLPPDTVDCDTLYNGDQIDTVICHTLETQWVTCDTSWDGGVREIVCDTLLVDTLSGTPTFGRLDSLLDVEAPAFVGNLDLMRIAHVSYDGGNTWTYKTSDTLYNVFAAYQTDTTQLMNFIFWLRARDPVDSTLYDPTPSFVPLRVLSAKFERDVLVINWTSVAHENRALSDSAMAYWERAVDAWALHYQAQAAISLDSDRDLVWAADFSSESDLLETALKYKILVLQQDAAVSGTWSAQGSLVRQVLDAVGTGACAWAAVRVPLGTHGFGAGPAIHLAPPDYAYTFGVEQVTFSGWARGFYNDQDGFGLGLPRIEDFVGADSENPEAWPDLEIDTALLRARYDWQGSLEPPEFPYYPFLPEIGALPEVGWADPAPDADIMYRYQSLYGATHPIYPELSFEGFPVMHRLDREAFRTVHSLFTPLAFEPDGAQAMVNVVLDWLYEPWLVSVTPSERFRLLSPVSASELRQGYLDRRKMRADQVSPQRTSSGDAK